MSNQPIRPVSQLSTAVHEPTTLTNCDRKPIRIPGLIQPHGILIVLERKALKVSQVSKNINQIYNKPIQELLNQPLSVLL